MPKDTGLGDATRLTFKDVVDLLEVVEVFDWCESIDIKVGDSHLKVNRGSNGGGRRPDAASGTSIRRTIQQISSAADANVEEKSAVVDSPEATSRENLKDTEEISKNQNTVEEKIKVIDAPSIGTFYRAPNPDSPPFVEIGDRVSQGDVVAIVEVMKLFAEISSPFDGIIENIMASNGALVEYKQPLIAVKLT